MAQGKGGSASQKRIRDVRRAAEMKRLGIERTTGICALCYRLIRIDSSCSRYTHVCRW